MDTQLAGTLTHEQATLNAIKAVLRSEAIRAMVAGGPVHHVEQRQAAKVVAPCPLAEVLADLLHDAPVSHALLLLLRYGTHDSVIELRNVIAERYAELLAPDVASIGWGAR